MWRPLHLDSRTACWVLQAQSGGASGGWAAPGPGALCTNKSSLSPASPLGELPATPDDSAPCWTVSLLFVNLRWVVLLISFVAWMNDFTCSLADHRACDTKQNVDQTTKRFPVWQKAEKTTLDQVKEINSRGQSIHSRSELKTWKVLKSNAEKCPLWLLY